MNGKRLMAGALACLMLAGVAGCGKKDEVLVDNTPKGTAVEVQTVQTGEMSAQSSLAGTVTAVKEIQVFPQLGGTVTALNVAEGDTVSNGQLLFQVDTSTVTSTYASLQQSYTATKNATDEAISAAQIGVDKAQMGISQAQIGVDQAQTALDNTRALFEAGAASEQQVTQAEQAYQNAENGLQQAQASLQQAQVSAQQARAQQQASLSQIRASMAQIEAQAKLGTVTSPVSGLVTAVNIDRGGMAAQSGPAVVIAEGGLTQVTVAVSETVLSGLQVGDTGAVTLQSVSADPMQGVITTIATSANAQTKLYDVTLALPDDVKPPIGAFASVTLYTDRRADAVQIPTEAILTDGEAQYVFVLTSEAPASDDADNTQEPDDAQDPEDEAQDPEDGADAQDQAQEIRAWAARVDVTTGLIGDGVTEITSGLAGGEELVVKGQSYLSDGSPVRVVSGEAQ